MSGESCTHKSVQLGRTRNKDVSKSSEGLINSAPCLGLHHVSLTVCALRIAGLPFEDPPPRLPGSDFTLPMLSEGRFIAARFRRITEMLRPVRSRIWRAGRPPRGFGVPGMGDPFLGRMDFGLKSMGLGCGCQAKGLQSCREMVMRRSHGTPKARDTGFSTWLCHTSLTKRIHWEETKGKQTKKKQPFVCGRPVFCQRTQMRVTHKARQLHSGWYLSVALHLDQ